MMYMTIVGFTSGHSCSVNFKFHSWFAWQYLLVNLRSLGCVCRVDDSWFRNLRLTSSYETTDKILRLARQTTSCGGVPLEVSGRVNAQTSRFRQPKVRSDLSNYCVLPGQYSFVFTQRLGSAFSMHIVTIVRAERTLSTSGFNNDSLIYL